jgi:hypothetical protein
MNEQPENALPKAIKEVLWVIFPHQLPDPAFVERLGQKLSAQVDQITTPRRKFKALVSPLAWGLIGLILILSLIWGINTLIPREEPLKNAAPSKLPSALPTSPIPLVSTLSLDHAVFYTVKAGDTLVSIEGNTGVPVETIQDLNVFVLQANDLVAGLKLLIGFKGQAAVFYTVQEGDSVKSICAKANISIEEFDIANRLSVPIRDSENATTVPQYKLIPGMRVIVGLEDLSLRNDEGFDQHLIILSEIDLDCDSSEERILGIETPEIQYLGITPQLSAISLEISTRTGFEKVWQLTAQEASAAYLTYKLFQPDDCTQFLVVLSHKGKEGVNVYRWDGESMTVVLKLSGRFLFEGDWMTGMFGDYQKSPNTLYLGELQQPTSSSKNTWILRGYQWSNGQIKLVVERRLETNAGG